MRVTLRSLLALSFVALLSVTPQSVLAQAEEAPAQEQSAPARTITGLELEGQIKSVGVEERIVLLTGRDGAEMLFHYDDQTEVVGEIASVQGLSSESGAWARITYRAEGDRATAERIELIAAPEGEEAPEAEPAPAPAPNF